MQPRLVRVGRLAKMAQRMLAPSHAALFELAEALLAQPSPYGHEAPLAEFVATRLRAAGCHEVLRVGDSLCVAPRPLRGEGARVALLGHLDTVPELSPNPVHRAGDRLYGTGASDMKGALALMIAACERAVREAPRHELVAVFYAREEGPFDASELPAILAAAGSSVRDASLAICLEPTDARIELGCMGAAQVAVAFTGRRAHSARPWQGRNAIHAAAPLLTRLAARVPRELQIGGLPWVEVVSATTIGYRGSINVVPDRCEIGLNVRFAPGRTRAELEGELRELIGEGASFAITAFWPAGRVVSGSPLVEELRLACGGAPLASKQAWTDVGRLGELGIAAINWGPGATSQAHQAMEWIDLRELARAADALGRWLFGDPASAGTVAGISGGTA